jgi:hypothetical protein
MVVEHWLWFEIQAKARSAGKSMLSNFLTASTAGWAVVGHRPAQVDRLNVF